MNVKKAIVLIVGEASDNLIEMNRLLQKQYEIRLANSGRAALAVMQQVPRPDLVVLDTALPDIDGYAVCQQLKSNPDTADIPVIFLQARDEGDEARALMEGGADVVAKPVVGDVLRARPTRTCSCATRASCSSSSATCSNTWSRRSRWS